MGQLNDFIKEAENQGYHNENAEAKVCQDIVLKALSMSTMSQNATIKGGVVMRSLSDSVRRATLDIDIDFIRYSLSDESILHFIENLNCIEGIKIQEVGNIEELKQQDYKGKRVYITISDESGDVIESKIDLGVHKDLDIEQENYCFDIAYFEEGANLLINSSEQMFTEKLRSLLKFGRFSTRFKDIFDMCYLTTIVDDHKLMKCFNVYIFDDQGMRENNMNDVLKRINRVFSNKQYIRRLSTSRKNWLDLSVEETLQKIKAFLEEIN